MRRIAIALACSLASALPALAQAVTTRIETRPYYGAIVTIEQGVRVWRALPPHDRIIIVPENAKNVKVHVHAGGQHDMPPPVSMNSSVNINQVGGSHSGVGYAPYAAGSRHHRPHHSGSGAYPSRRH